MHSQSAVTDVTVSVIDVFYFVNNNRPLLKWKLRSLQILS